MPNVSLADLKRKYRDIICIPVGQIEAICRVPTLREYRAFRTELEIGLRPRDIVYDEIFRDIVLDEVLIDEYNTLPAGLVDSVVDAVLLISGNLLQTEEDIARINSDIDAARQYVEQDVYNQLSMIICKAFPRYTPSDLDDMEWSEFLRVLLMAEQMLGLEEPIKVEAAKKKSLIDKVFEDARKAEEMDRPSPGEHRQMNAQRGVSRGSMDEVKKQMDMETIRKLQERRRNIEQVEGAARQGPRIPSRRGLH
jgi:hypothetical protein